MYVCLHDYQFVLIIIVFVKISIFQTRLYPFSLRQTSILEMSFPYLSETWTATQKHGCILLLYSGFLAYDQSATSVEFSYKNANNWAYSGRVHNFPGI